MKYYKTINYIWNIWKSDGHNWWFKAHNEWRLWITPNDCNHPYYDAVSIEKYIRPKEISEKEVFIELL